MRGVKALANITGDGLLNLLRVAAPVGFVIDALIEPHPIFPLIQRHAEVDDAEMFEVFNMGIGFATWWRRPTPRRRWRSSSATGGCEGIGHAVADPEKTMRIPPRGLLGQHKRFWNDGRAARRAG